VNEWLFSYLSIITAINTTKTKKLEITKNNANYIGTWLIHTHECNEASSSGSTLLRLLLTVWAYSHCNQPVVAGRVPSKNSPYMKIGEDVFFIATQGPVANWYDELLSCQSKGGKSPIILTCMSRYSSTGILLLLYCFMNGEFSLW